MATPAREATDPGLRLGVAAAGLRWRLRCEGEGPDLLRHGTSSSLHAWQACSRLLRPHFRVWRPDLPGLDHLAQEEDPEQVAALLNRFWAARQP